MLLDEFNHDYAAPLWRNFFNFQQNNLYGTVPQKKVNQMVSNF